MKCLSVNVSSFVAETDGSACVAEYFDGNTQRFSGGIRWILMCDQRDRNIMGLCQIYCFLDAIERVLFWCVNNLLCHIKIFLLDVYHNQCASCHFHSLLKYVAINFVSKVKAKASVKRYALTKAF